MEKASDIEIDKIDTGSVEFQNALKLISYTSQSVFLTGKAGTGKSTFLKYLTTTTKKKFVVLAPTGIAAVNAGGQTIHSFFKMPFKPLVPTDPDLYTSASRLRERMKYSKETVKLLQTLDLIIIDEVSMVRADMIDFIDRILRVYCHNPRQPFAGKQLLLVGDVFQLEPVITGDMRDVLGRFYTDGFYFFNARVFDEMSIVPIELTKVYRQNDPTFISLLDRIRVGSSLRADLEVLNHRVMPPSLQLDEDFVITIATRRDIVDEINQGRLNEIKRPLRTYEGKICDDFPTNSLPTDLELELKEGAQVVFVRNDKDRRWVNGTLGRVDSLSDESITIVLADDTKHVVEREIWENIRYEYDEEHKCVKEVVIGTFEQFPIKLAWALTIHKSQGLTFDRVIIDVGSGAFSGGQTYVALSRCRSLEGIMLRQPIRDRDVFVSTKVTNFSRSFNDGTLISSALDHARADDCYHRAAVCFDHGEYDQAVKLFVEAVNARNVLDQPLVGRLLSYKLASLTSKLSEVEELKTQINQYEDRLLHLATEYVDMGEDVREEGWDLSAAIANYDKAISLSPTYHLAWLGKGLALAQMGEIDAATSALTHAAELETNDYRPYYEAGQLMMNHDVIQAINYLLQALDRNDNIPAIYYGLADAYESIGDKDTADEYRKKGADAAKN